MKIPAFLYLVMFTSTAFAAQPKMKKCFFVASYHKGYAWQDGLEQTLMAGLKDKCEIQTFYMDTKRNERPEFATKMGLLAKEAIEKWNPDIILASDDNATKYLVQPYFKDSKIPVVFCGINWTVAEYGLPYKNTTGMIEVNAVTPFYVQLKSLLPAAKNGVCLGAENETDTKVCDRFRLAGLENNYAIEKILVKDMKQWKKIYKDSQELFDFVILSNNAGIKDWKDSEALQWVEETTKKFSFSVHDWIAKYAAFSMTSLPEEQGEFLVNATLSIFNGAAPTKIPIESNTKWRVLMNKKIIDKLGIKMPQSILEKARDLSEK